LSEDVKQALLTKDLTKKSAKSSKKKAAKSGRVSASRRESAPSTGFKAGGNANDPLNANL
jgi:hypothetical protein